MIRIQRVYSTALPSERERVEQVQEIFRENFPDVADYADRIPEHLNDPFRFGYRSILLVSETGMRKVTGFSLFIRFPEINAALLDFLAVRRSIRGGGIGSTLYEATRAYLQGAGARGLFLEALSDDPTVVKDPALVEENRKRMAFYGNYGAQPVTETEYETPIDDSPAPLLLFDPLERDEPLRRSEARAAVRLILRRKYGHIVTPDYIERVVESFVDDPVRFRAPVPAPGTAASSRPPAARLQKTIALVYSDRHKMHYVHDQGYVERPARAGALLESLVPTGLFGLVDPRRHGEDAIRAVHDGDFVTYLKTVCSHLDAKRPVYPYVFPIRRPERKPRELAVRAGYYCIDTFTPLDRNAYDAARVAVDVALTATEELVNGGYRVAYALCRPPGHHAERRVFGGFCYFNNAAVAAHVLSRQGKVAVLDIDFHHGNGTQDIFYRRDDVLTVSIHGHPNFAYPYFSGFADERGEGPGEGFNVNYPLPEGTDGARHREAFDKALARIRRFEPLFLVVSLGFDTLRGDPTGAFCLTPGDLGAVGRRLGSLGLPILVVQEGGYNLRNLRKGAVAFFTQMVRGIDDDELEQGAAASRRGPSPGSAPR